MTRPKTPLTNILAAAAIALAGAGLGAAPAKADNDDVIRGLAGLAAAGIIIGAITQHNRNAARDAPSSFGTIDPPGFQTYGQPQARPFYPGRRASRLPAACALSVDGEYGPQVWYAESCLRDQGFDRRLPRDCAQNLRGAEWQGRVYDGGCLQNNGFRVERRY